MIRNVGNSKVKMTFRQVISCIILSCVMFIGLGLIKPNLSYAVYQDKCKDPATEGKAKKASTEVEKAIAAGKTLTGKTSYKLGAGHGSSWSSMGETPKLSDCSAFVRWAYAYGAGIDMGDVTTFNFGKAEKYRKHGSDYKRGDLLICNNGGHVVIYLGGNKATLGCNGTDAQGGVQMENSWNISVYSGSYIDMSEVIKDKSVWTKFDKTKNVSIDGADDSDSDSKSEGTDAGSTSHNEGYKPFEDREYKRDNLGSGSYKEAISQNNVATLSAVADTVVAKLKIGMWIIGAILILVISVILLWYIALPSLGWEWQDRFESMFGIGDRNRNNTIQMTILAVESYTLVGLILSGIYMYPIVGFISFIQKLM